MAKPGSPKRPAIVRVRSEARGEEIVSLCTGHGWQVIAGVEPDKPEDISDVEELSRGAQETVSSPRSAARVRPNDYCPCGSGKKFKKCCGVA